MTIDARAAAAYLARIGYHGSREPSLATLRALHHAHLLAVPFENLHIHYGRPVVLDATALYDKIVTQRRGGFCYELNGLFAALLRHLGFDVALLSARVARASGGLDLEFGHLTLLVRLDERWLADVGFGDSFDEPLRLDDPAPQPRDGRDYRLARDGADWTLLQRDSAAPEDDGWREQYVFTLQPRQPADFAAMCHFHQTSPESPFTRQRVCTLLTPAGRITLGGWRLIETVYGERQERELAGEDECTAILREQFGIVLDPARDRLKEERG